MGLPILGDILNAGAKIIDSLHTSEEEKLEAKGKLNALLTGGVGQIIDYFTSELEERSKNIRAETGSDSWLAKNWRPLTMLTFVFIIAWNHIVAPIVGMFTDQIISLEIVPDMWDLLKIGLGGYVVGRSAEKAIRMWRTKEEV